MKVGNIFYGVVILYLQEKDYCPFSIVMTNFGISLLLRSIFRIKFVLHPKHLVFCRICPEVPLLFIQYIILLNTQ